MRRAPYRTTSQTADTDCRKHTDVTGLPSQADDLRHFGAGIARDNHAGPVQRGRESGCQRLPV